MKTVPFKPTIDEYVEAIACDEYSNFTTRAVFNVAVAIAYGVMAQSKRLVPTAREWSGAKTGTPQMYKYAERNPPKRLNAELTDDAFVKLNAIRRYYHLPTGAATVSFCLRTLRAYTDKRGVSCLESWSKAKSDKVVRRSHRVPVSLSLDSETVTLLKARSIKLSISLSAYISQVLDEHLKQLP